MVSIVSSSWDLCLGIDGVHAGLFESVHYARARERFVERRTNHAAEIVNVVHIDCVLRVVCIDVLVQGLLKLTKHSDVQRLSLARCAYTTIPFLRNSSRTLNDICEGQPSYMRSTLRLFAVRSPT